MESIDILFSYEMPSSSSNCDLKIKTVQTVIWNSVVVFRVIFLIFFFPPWDCTFAHMLTFWLHQLFFDHLLCLQLYFFIVSNNFSVENTWICFYLFIYLLRLKLLSALYALKAFLPDGY